LTGSSTFIESLSTAFVHEIETTDGTKVKDDLARIGYLGEEVPGARSLDSFFEAHIEQGPILEQQGITIGAVTQIQGLRFLSVEVTGEDGHAGTVPMTNRRDAMAGAARMIVFLDDLAAQIDDRIRITIGTLKVTPNSGSTIPGKVNFTIDLRHPEAEVLSAALQRIASGLEAIAERARLAVSIETRMEKPPVHFDPAIVELVEQSANALGVPCRRILSGAGHDAMNLAQRVPTGMIFVPCENGISHNEKENAKPEDLATGASVLLHGMLARAGIAGHGRSDLPEARSVQS
jgi:N-carbamoyl-L-amino-acid hydrolase